MRSRISNRKRRSTIGGTAAAPLRVTRRIHPQQARRPKFAVVISLIGHAVLLMWLYKQGLHVPGPPPGRQLLLAAAPPLEDRPAAEQFPLDQRFDSSASDEFEEPIATTSPLPQAVEVRRRDDPLGLNRDEDPRLQITERDLPSQYAPLDHPPDVLVRASSKLVRTSRREPVEAMVHSIASPDSLPPLLVEDQYLTSELRRPAATALDVPRAARPRLAPPIGTPGRERRAPDRRRIEPASLPEMPSHILDARLWSDGIRRPAPAYAARGERQYARLSPDESQTTTESSAAIERGLEFLAGVQLEDGRWEFRYLGGGVDPNETERIIIDADAAATGLALLAFLGAGYDHAGGQYEDTVLRGLQYLVGIQAPSGELYVAGARPTSQVSRLYGHGIATLALCEAYGMTGDPALRVPAQLAIDFLVESQHQELGGWRYVPGINSDLSVSGWQLMALKAGELAGLHVPPETYSRLRALVERCRERDGQRARFCYNPWASPSDPRTRHGRQPSTVMTAVGMSMQLALGGETADERLQAGANHLLANLPRFGEGRKPAATGTLGNPERDAYYWFYATQVMHLLGGKYWQSWNEQLGPLLIGSQITTGPMSGSWDPDRPAFDKWADYGGRLYVTSLSLLSLEAHERSLKSPHASPSRVANRPE
jgi:hypothetical protein